MPRLCQKCSGPLPWKVMIEGKERNLASRRYCLSCSPFGSHNTLKLVERGRGHHEHRCTHCGEEDPGGFYPSQYTMCKRCNNRYILQKMRRNKRRMIEYLGGKCQVCGYDRYDCALEMHHLDRAKKSKTFQSVRSWSWQRIEREIANCVLLCANCHSAVEAGYLILPESAKNVRA